MHDGVKFYHYFFPIYNRIRTIARLKTRIVGSGNTCSNLNIFTSKCNFEIIGSTNHISFGEFSKIGSVRLKIIGDNNTIIIGKHCRIMDSELWIEDNNCVISIGDFTTVESAHIAVTESNSKIRIGEDCMLAKKIVIRTGDSHSIIDLESNKRINYAKSVQIGNHVWVGERSTILKGVNIEDDVIIGTGAIITTDCPANVIMAGVPAKILRTNVTWKRERIDK